jgi:hypothetical protein
MFRFEIENRTIPDELPVSVIRELQVEQFWARRTVLADQMNEERINLYASRRALLAPDRLKPTDSSWSPTLQNQSRSRAS